MHLVGFGRLACSEGWGRGLSAGHVQPPLPNQTMVPFSSLRWLGRVSRAVSQGVRLSALPGLGVSRPVLPRLPAAIARRVYLRGDVGVGAFKKIFGGRAHRGTRPEKFATGSGAIARHILRQLEALKIVEHIPEGKEGHRKGCAATPGLEPCLRCLHAAANARN